MAKGRNAAKAFTATRGARFAEARKAAEQKRQAEREAGTRQTLLLVDVGDVQEGDEVTTKNRGFVAVEETTEEEVVVVNGQTAVMRYVVTEK